MSEKNENSSKKDMPSVAHEISALDVGMPSPVKSEKSHSRNLSKNDSIEFVLKPIEPKRSDEVQIKQRKSSKVIQSKQELSKKSFVKIPSYRDKIREKDNANPNNTKFYAIDGFEGPVRKRRFTDWLCLFPFLLLTLGFMTHFGYLFLIGTPYKLFNHDFRARECGFNELASKPFLYYLQPSIDMNVKMCVEFCPNYTGAPICLYEPNGINATVFCYTQMTTEAVGSTCYPVEPFTRKRFIKSLESSTLWFVSFVKDLYISIDVIVGCMIIAPLLSLLVLKLLIRISMTKTVIWICLLNVIVMLGALSLFFYKEYRYVVDLNCIFGISKRDCGGTISTVYYALIFVMIGLAAFYLIVLSIIFNKINLVASLIKTSFEISHKLKSNTLIAFLPVTIFLVLFPASLILIVNMFSLGKTIVVDALNIDGNLVKVFEHSFEQVPYLAGDLFVLKIFLDFWLNLNDYVMSYMITIWFFYKKKDTVYLPLGRVLKSTFRYHLGSLFLFTVLDFFFGIFTSIFGCLHDALNTKNSSFTKFLRSICIPLFSVYTVFLRYLKNDFYIQNFMWSSSFWESAQKSYFLIKVRNSHRGDGPNALYHFVLFLIKLSICLTSAVIYLIVLSFLSRNIFGYYTTDIKYKFMVFAVVMFITYYEISCFFDSFEIINKTMLQCFYLDEEMFIGEQRYAEEHMNELIKYYDDKNKDKELVKASSLKGDGYARVNAERISVGNTEESFGKSLSNTDSDNDDGFQPFGRPRKVEKNLETDFVEAEDNLNDKLERVALSPKNSAETHSSKQFDYGNAEDEENGNEIIIVNDDGDHVESKEIRLNNIMNTPVRNILSATGMKVVTNTSWNRIDNYEINNTIAQNYLQPQEKTQFSRSNNQTKSLSRVPSNNLTIRNNSDEQMEEGMVRETKAQDVGMQDFYLTAEKAKFKDNEEPIV